MTMQGQEKFAGQSMLAMDPRSERPSRLCPGCASNKARTLGMKNELEIRCCMVCRTLYSPYSPWYTTETYYDNYYEQRMCNEPPVVAKRLREIIAEFSRYRQTNRLLDVGCGAGLLLEAARDNGWEAQGVDVSASSVNHVRLLGLEAFHGELKQARLEAEQFDVITAVEIVEHLFEPVTVVTEIHRLLRPGGLFWLTTPHALGLTSRLKGLDWGVVSPPEHLQVFSIKGLRELLFRAGFSNVRFQTTGVDPFEIWQALRKQNVETTQENSKALATKYRLNEAMSRNTLRRVLKKAANELLNFCKLGDSLKAFAIR